MQRRAHDVSPSPWRARAWRCRAGVRGAPGARHAGERLPDVPWRPAGRAPVGRPPRCSPARRPPQNGFRLRRLPRRRRRRRRRGGAAQRRDSGFKGAPRGQAQIATLRALPQRRRADAPVRAARSASTRPRSTRRACTASGCPRRYERGDVRELPWRARHPPGQRREVAGLSDQRGRRPARRATPTRSTWAATRCRTARRCRRTSWPSTRRACTTRRWSKGNDLSAPTCNDCHGNHGAAPPGVGSIVNVCGTCHAVFAEKFADQRRTRTSSTAAAWSATATTPCCSPPTRCLGTGDGALCGSCHSDDTGAAAAEHMRDGHRRPEGPPRCLDRAAVGPRQLRHRSGRRAADAREAGNALTLARTDLHAFTPTAVDEAVAGGITALDEIDAAGDAGERELRFRRRGLAVSLGLILLFVVALALKIRSIDRRTGS